MYVSYVCTRVVSQSTSGRAGRFWKKIPESDDLAGSETKQRSPPRYGEKEKHTYKESRGEFCLCRRTINALRGINLVYGGQ